MPDEPSQALQTYPTKRTLLAETQHNKDKHHQVADPERNRLAASEGPRARARSRDTTETGQLRDEPVSLTVNDPRWVAPRNATEVADDRILANMRVEARQRRNNGTPYDPILGPFAPQHANPTSSTRDTPATPAVGSQNIGPDHREHNTTAAGWLHQFQHHRVTQARSRRRTDSMSPQRSEVSSSDEQPGYGGPSTNITFTFINMAGDTITQMVLNSSDTFVTVGHLYGHAKRHLQIREKDFSLVIGTHNLDKLSARLFCIRPIQDAVRTSTDHTISLTLIRIHQVADPPPHQLDIGPRQLRFHVHRAPAWGNPRAAVLNLIPGQQQQGLDLPVYPITIRRIIAAIGYDQVDQQRTDFDALTRARRRPALGQRAPNEQAQREQTALGTEPAAPHRRDPGPCFAAHNTAESHTQPNNSSAPKLHTVTRLGDKHRGAEETALNDRDDPDTQTGGSISASHAASSAEPPGKKCTTHPAQYRKTRGPTPPGSRWSGLSPCLGSNAYTLCASWKSQREQTQDVYNRPMAARSGSSESSLELHLGCFGKPTWPPSTLTLRSCCSEASEQWVVQAEQSQAKTMTCSETSTALSIDYLNPNKQKTQLLGYSTALRSRNSTP